MDAELNWLNGYIDRWIQEWCNAQGDPRLKWHLLHDALGYQLLLSARIVGKSAKSDSTSIHQRMLFDVASRMFTEALRTPQNTHMTHRASVFPFAAAIMLRFCDRRDLVLRLALRMAGDHYGPHVPTFVRDAGNQMLAMLWFVFTSADSA